MTVQLISLEYSMTYFFYILFSGMLLFPPCDGYPYYGIPTLPMLLQPVPKMSLCAFCQNSRNMAIYASSLEVTSNLLSSITLMPMISTRLSVALVGAPRVAVPRD